MGNDQNKTNKKSDLLILDEMAKQNLQIKCSTTFVAANKDKRGGTITMGIDELTLLEMWERPDRYVIVMYLAEADQFFALKEGRQLPGTEAVSPV